MAIIPCRSGSISVKDKNIRLLNGKPLMAYAIEAAKKAEKVSRVVVSTDSMLYAETAKKHGADIIFRPAILGEDVPTELVLQHAILYMIHSYDLNDIVVTLQCTTPLMLPEDIDTCIGKMKDDRYDSVITVTECSEHPEWMYRSELTFPIPYPGPEMITYLKPIIDDVVGAKGVRQFLPTLLRPTGAVYVTRLSTLFLENRIIGKKCGYVIIPKLRSFDIDDEDDFIIVEALIKELERREISLEKLLRRPKNL